MGNKSVGGKPKCGNCEYCDIIRNVSGDAYYKSKRYYCFEGDKLMPIKLTSTACNKFKKKAEANLK